MNELDFVIEHHAVAHEPVAVPLIDGRPLAEWIDRFELVARMRPAGEMYGGLRANDLDVQPFQPGLVKLVLGCCCGFADCWPLMADIEEDRGRIVWRNFRQPRRSTRDYTKLGTFRFDANRYHEALGKLAELV